MEKKEKAPKKTTAKKTAPKKKAEMQASGTETAPKARKKAAPRKASAKACKVQNCKRHYRAKGYCNSHYREWRHGKFAKPRYTRCHDYGCNKPMATNRHGFCEEHFQNFYVKGMEVTHAPVAAPAKPKEEKKEETAA